MTEKFNKIEKEYVEEYNKRIDIINESVFKFNNAATNLFYIALHKVGVNVSECKVKLTNKTKKIKDYRGYDSYNSYKDRIGVIITDRQGWTVAWLNDITYEDIQGVLQSDRLLEKFAKTNIFNTHKEANRYAIQKQISDLEQKQEYRRSPQGRKTEARLWND